MPSRTREKSVPRKTTWSFYRYGLPYGAPWYQFDTALEYSKITDEEGSPPSNQWKACFQWKLSVELPNFSHTGEWVSFPGVPISMSNYNFFSSTGYVKNLLYMDTVQRLPVTKKDMTSRLWPPIDFSAFLFLAEIRSTLDMFKLPMKFAKNAWKSFRNKPITRRERVRLGTSIRTKVGKTAADTYLAAKFGVEPLANDMGALAQAYALVVAKWSEILQSARVWTPYTKSDKIVHPDRVVITHPHTGITVKYVIKAYTVRKTAWKMRPVVPNIPFPPLEYVASALGIMPSLKGLWELRPMSFVFDWFSNAGEVLDSVDSTGFRVSVEKEAIGSYCKTHLSVVGTVISDTWLKGSPALGFECARGEATIFSRDNVVSFQEIDAKVFKLKNPFNRTSDAGKALTLAALAKQKASGSSR